ncbi:MAG: helix-turn-helix domain-containing protein [Thiogranum sp.]
MSNPTQTTHPPAKKEQVMEALNCGQTTYWKLIKAGELPNTFKVGRENRTPWSDILDYQARHRISA